MPLNPFDKTGSRIRTDSEALAAELAALPDAEREATAAFISASLDVEELQAAEVAGETEKRRRECAADAARMAAAKNPTVDRIDELRRVIAAQRQQSSEVPS